MFGALQAGQDSEEGRLATPRGPDDRDKLTVLDLEVEVIKDLQILLAGAQAMAHALALNLGNGGWHRVQHGKRYAGATMLVHMFARHRIGPVLLTCFLVACGNSEQPESEARLGDSWEGQATTEIHELGEIPADAPKVVFLGDSLSAGLHLAEDQAYPAILQRRLAERGLPFHLVNAGVSGDTTAGGLRRIEWILKQYPDLVVVELGGNDGLRGIDVATIESNLRKIVERIQESGVTPVLFGMRIPTSYGAEYSEAFRAVYDRVAEDLDVTLLPDWLEGVGGDPRYNLPDGLHPNERGHEMLADNIEAVLSDVIEDL